MTVLLKWTPRVFADEQRLYRDTSPFDINSLPTPLVVLTPSISEYTDTTANVDFETYYYAIGTVVDSISPEKIALSEVVSVTVGESSGSAGISSGGGGFPAFRYTTSSAQVISASSEGAITAFDTQDFDDDSLVSSSVFITPTIVGTQYLRATVGVEIDGVTTPEVEIHLQKSTDGGYTWESIAALTETSAISAGVVQALINVETGDQIRPYLVNLSAFNMNIGGGFSFFSGVMMEAV